MNDSERSTEVAVGLGDGLPQPLWHYEDFPGETDRAPDEGLWKLISLGEIGSAINRSKKIWCVAAVVGLLLGTALFITTKPSYTVSVDVLMSNNPALDAVTQQDTNQLLAQSPALAAAMVKKLGLTETPAEFLQAYTVTVTSNQVLTLAIGSPTAAQATSWAQALATGFLNLRAQTLNDQQTAVFAAEEQQVTAEQQAVNSLNKQISKVSSGATSGTSLADLQAQQVKASDKLTALQQSVAESQASARITTTSMISGSSILSIAPPAALHSPKKTLLEYVVGGLLAGLVVGMGFVAVRAVVTDRLRRRSDIAEALGAPVRISVAATGAGGRSLVRRRGQASQPDGGIPRVVSYLRTALPSKTKDAATLAVVAVDNEKPSASIVAALAAACARDGKRVLVVDLSGGALAQQLGVTAAGIHTVTIEQEHVQLSVPEPGDPAPAGPLSRRIPFEAADSSSAAAFSDVDLLITLAALDPAVGADYLATWANEAVVLVTAGASTTRKISATGEMIKSAGIHFASAVLLGTDRNDESLGVLS